MKPVVTLKDLLKKHIVHMTVQTRTVRDEAYREVSHCRLIWCNLGRGKRFFVEPAVGGPLIEAAWPPFANPEDTDSIVLDILRQATP